MKKTDVPIPVNFLLMQDALDWERTAMDRPFRIDMFKGFVDCFKKGDFQTALELGSGPGFLAKYICEHVPEINLTLLDFSAPMHELARKRLNSFATRISIVRRDFKEPGWTEGLGRFDCVFSNQAVHELRHKSRAFTFHRQVRDVLSKRGTYLVCDHFYGQDAMKNDQLYMSPEEQVACLQESGFSTEVLLKKGSLQLIRAT